MVDKRDDLETAERVSVAACNVAACGCGAIYVRLHDDSGKIFAMAGMSAEIAFRVGMELIKVALENGQLDAGVAGHA